MLPPPSDRPPPPYVPAGWRRLDPVARGLMLARALRSVAQGSLAADFVLFLHALGWNASAIGALLTAASFAGGLLGLAVGPFSDRYGRRPFLLAYQVGLAACTVAVVAAPDGPVIVLGAVLFGYGLGANGAAGPFAPAEQAWLAAHVGDDERGGVFSLNAAMGFLGMAAGAVVGGLVPLWAGPHAGPRAYLPLMLLTAAIAAANYVQIAALSETRAPAPPVSADARVRAGPLPPDIAEAASEAQTRRHENRAMLLLVVINGVNSLGIGLFGPLLPYWFAVRYHVGAGAIGSVYALTFALTAVASLVTGQIVARVGLVKAIVWLRVAGVALLGSMPFMPTFALAAALYTTRSVINRGSVGARQAFGVGLVRDHRRGMASSLNAVSWSLPSALGPVFSGWLMAAGSIDIPFYLAAALQLVYAVLFGTVLGRYEPSASRSRERGGT